MTRSISASFTRNLCWYLALWNSGFVFPNIFDFSFVPTWKYSMPTANNSQAGRRLFVDVSRFLKFTTFECTLKSNWWGLLYKLALWEFFEISYLLGFEYPNIFSISFVPNIPFFNTNYSQAFHGLVLDVWRFLNLTMWFESSLYRVGCYLPCFA